MAPRPWPLALAALMMVAACTPGREEPAANPAATPATTAGASASSPEAQPEPPMPTASSATPAPREPATASIAGSIRDGNRPPPALRVCASPVDGGAPTCIETATGSVDYRIEVAPGRYYLLGWAGGGEVALIAHAMQIRCIRAPCPPDELIEVKVGAGEHRAGIDLTAGYIDVPAGWPQRPG